MALSSDSKRNLKSREPKARSAHAARISHAPVDGDVSCSVKRIQLIPLARRCVCGKKTAHHPRAFFVWESEHTHFDAEQEETEAHREAY